MTFTHHTLASRLPGIFKLLLIALGLWTLTFENRLTAADRPNILYIFTDDQSVRTLSCYPDAYNWVRTPNIDRLAKEGVRFRTSYMAPFCVPSRIGQLTGNLPHAARGTFNGDELTGKTLADEIRSHPFWPQKLRESGYHTGVIGKWHVYSRLPAVGIDWDMAVYWHKGMVNAYYYDQKVSLNGAQPIDLNGYSVDRHTDFAVDYLKQRAKADEPWYLWLCYSSPHSPQIPANRHVEEYAAVSDHKIPIPESFHFREGKPNYVQKVAKPKTTSIKNLVRRYHECILSIDENVGRLTETLRQTGQLEDTVIIFASDQGLGMGHHGHVKKKNAPYEATLNSPLIFRYPAMFPKNVVCSEPVIGPDVVQTLHDLTGINALPSMDGESLLPLLVNPASKLSRDVLLMTNTRTSFSEGIPNGVKRRNREAAETNEMPMWSMIRSGDYKYATYTGDGFEEIYDLANDPKELSNLALSPVHQPLLHKLRQQAANELIKTQSGFSDGHFLKFFPHLEPLAKRPGVPRQQE
ncbi:MAG: hypothetical protein CBB71_07290 [Rhodopirellula sp. TMED11]|nr:MAG: hypothetical protein CBB71_07290 [Rhodopirellula sp. TMED11]